MSITKEQAIWFPGIYHGREGEPWVTPIGYFSDEEIVEFVQQRANEDGEWAITNNFVGDNEDKMRKMMVWVSEETNIRQCIEAARKEQIHAQKIGNEIYEPRTVDWICRDLANGSKWVGSRV